MPTTRADESCPYRAVVVTTTQADHPARVSPPPSTFAASPLARHASEHAYDDPTLARQPCLNTR